MHDQWAKGGPTPPDPAAHLLLGAARWALRQADPMVAVVLHLSRLPAPGPQPYHRRVARAMFQDAADRSGGQVFDLRCGDLVMVCRATDRTRPQDSHSGPSFAPAAVPRQLARLLQTQVDCPDDLISVWPLPGEAAALASYAHSGSTKPAPEVLPEQDRAVSPSVAKAVLAAIEGHSVADLLRRQTAVLFVARSAGQRAMKPLFREVAFSIAAIEARIAGAASLAADPFIFRSTITQLDRRMLGLLQASRGGGGPLDAGQSSRPPLHINLTFAAIASEAFARFAADHARQPGTPALGVEVSLTEACGDPRGLRIARARVGKAGMAFVLEGVSHWALLLTEVAALEPDLVKLDWTPRLPALPRDEADRIAAAIARIGADRVLLSRADSETAIHWGVEHGVQRFQGWLIDAMLAAARVEACAYKDICGLRNCINWAAVADSAGRRLCRDLVLLDTASPREPSTVARAA
jgi:hypothetical protein